MVDRPTGPNGGSARSRAHAAQLLGVAVDAPVADIQRAFRSAVKEAHPDGGAADGEAFGELHAARELLLRPAADDGDSQPKEAESAGDGSRAGENKASAPRRAEGPPTTPRSAFENVESAAEPSPTAAVGSPPSSDHSSLFGRGVLLMAVGLGLLIGLLVAAAVVAGNETQSVRIAPVADVPDECIVVGAGTIQGASCDEPGALSVASQTSSSAACAAGTTRLEVPNGDTFCLRPEVQD